MHKATAPKPGTKPSPFSPGNNGTLENTAHGAVYQLLKRSVKPQHVPVEAGKTSHYKTTPQQRTEPGEQEQPELVTSPSYWGNWEPCFPKGAASASPSWTEGAGGHRRGQSQPQRPQHSGPKEETQGMRWSKNPRETRPHEETQTAGICVLPNSGPWDAATANPHERTEPTGGSARVPKVLPETTGAREEPGGHGTRETPTEPRGAKE